jgi:hypothetical protein
MKFFWAACLACTFLISCSPRRDADRTLLEVIPEDAAIILKINNLASFKRELRNNEFTDRWSKQNTTIPFRKKLTALQTIESEGQGVVVLMKNQEDSLGYVYITPSDGFLFQKDSTAAGTTQQMVYEGTEFSIHTRDSSAFYSTAFNAYLFLGDDYKLIQKVLRNMPENSPSEALSTLYKSASKEKTATLFIHAEKAAALSPYFFDQQDSLSFTPFADWISIDLSLPSDHILFSGIGLARDSTDQFLSLFSNTQPLVSSLPSLAPETADAILSYSFADETVFAENQLRAFPAAAEMENILNTTEEVGIIYQGANKGVLLNTYGASGLSEFLNMNRQTVYEYQGKEIGTLAAHPFLEEAFPALISNFKCTHYTIMDNAFLFSEDKAFMESMVRQINSGSTFDTSATYLTVKSDLAEESTVLFVAKNQYFDTASVGSLGNTLYAPFQATKFPDHVIAFQVVADRSFYHLNGVIKKKGSGPRRNAVTPLFTVQLDGPIAFNPQFVTDHRTDKKEIVVQDTDNNLYLIAADGKILWKKQLKGRIQGAIQQIDLYKNGRLQLAFTTDNQFLVLDRNGKEVLPFNKTYPGAILNPLAVFDYEGNKNYRFVVVQGTTVKMYNSKGQEVKGFGYTKASSPVLGTPKHFRIGSRDYLVFKLEDGSMKILNRVGQTRVPVNEKIDFSDNEVFLFNDKFIVTDKTGTLFSIDTKGKIAKTRFNLIQDHGMDATTKTLSLMNDNELTIKSNKATLDLGVYTRPRIFYIYDKIYVSVTDIQTQRAYLFDSNAIPFPNFPVFSSSAIDLTDMDNDRSIEIVGKFEENSIIVYQIN